MPMWLRVTFVDWTAGLKGIRQWPFQAQLRESLSLKTPRFVPGSSSCKACASSLGSPPPSSFPQKWDEIPLSMTDSWEVWWQLIYKQESPLSPLEYKSPFFGRPGYAIRNIGGTFCNYPAESFGGVAGLQQSVKDLMHRMQLPMRWCVFIILDATVRAFPGVIPFLFLLFPLPCISHLWIFTLPRRPSTINSRNWRMYHLLQSH